MMHPNYVEYSITLENYFINIKNSFITGALTGEYCRESLIATDGTGFTPLHNAIKHGNYEILQICLRHLGEACNLRILSQSDYAALLMPALFDVLNVEDFRISNSYFTEMHRVYNSKQLDIETSNYLCPILVEYFANGIVGVSKYLIWPQVNKLLDKIRELNLYSSHLFFDTDNTSPELEHIQLERHIQKLKCLLYNGVLTKSEYKLLLTHDMGVWDTTPLFHVLTTNKKYMISIFLQYIADACQSKILSLAEHMKLLKESTGSGWDPLQYVLRHCTHDVIKVYLKHIEYSCANNFLNRGDYVKLLIDVGYAGFSLLHTAITVSPPGVMPMCLRSIQNAHKDKILSDADYVKLLTAVNNAGFTPLHEALIKCNAEDMQIYLWSIQNAHKDKILSDADYVKLLTAVNKRGFSPLFDALVAGSEQVTELYLNEISYAVNAGLIDNDCYKNLVIARNISNYTLLHNIINNKNLDSGTKLDRVKIYFNIIEDPRNYAWEHNDIKDLLLQKDFRNTSTLVSAANYTDIPVLSFMVDKYRLYLNDNAYFCEYLKHSWGKIHFRQSAARSFLSKIIEDVMLSIEETSNIGNADVYAESNKSKVLRGSF